MVVEVLANIAPQLGCHDFCGLGIITVNSKIDRVPRVENADFCLLCRGLTFARLLLPEFRQRLCGLPDRIIKRPVELWRMLDARRLRHCADL